MLATDGSPSAQTAARWLATLPLPDDTTLLVVAVAEVPDAPLSRRPTPEWRAALLDATRHAAAEAVDVLRTRWSAVELRVPAEDPRHAIPRRADEWDADLVVVGSRGLGSVTGFMVGTVSSAVAHHACCSVLVVKGAPRGLRRILIAVDGSETALAAVRFVAALPLEPGTIVELVGVVTPPDYATPPMFAVAATPELVGAAMTMMEEDRRRLDTALTTAEALFAGRPVTIMRVLATGYPAREILAAAEQDGAELIVVGARGVGAVKRLLLGGVSTRVLEQARVPVLIVRTSA
jgi:nucleotide-binding universal stress UspA family protein